MAVPVISINQQNLSQGETTAVERRILFIGLNDENAASSVTATDAATVHTIGASTDLDAILGDEASPLKTQIEAAQQNVGPNWTAYVVPLYSALGSGDTGTPFSDWQAALEIALGQPNDITPEMVFLTNPVTSAADLATLQAAATNAISTWWKYLTIHAPVAGNDGSQTWAEYITATKALLDSKEYDRVYLVPQLMDTNLGVIAGRLSSEYVSVGDSPMRVATGACAGLGSIPEDSDGVALELDHLAELANANFSVPYWYPGRDGIFWADHVSLTDETNDFHVIENRRVVDYCTRRIRLLMINVIANRAFNSSASSTAYYQKYFLAPVSAAAKATSINGQPAAGLVKQPTDDDMTITWTSKTAVELGCTVTPLDSGKNITLNIALDLSSDS